MKMLNKIIPVQRLIYKVHWIVLLFFQVHKNINKLYTKSSVGSGRSRQTAGHTTFSAHSFRSDRKIKIIEEAYEFL